MSRHRIDKLALTFALCAASWCIADRASAYTLKLTEAGKNVRWRSPRVEVYVHESMLNVLSHVDARRAVSIGTDAWTGLGGPRLYLMTALDTREYRPGQAGTQIVLADPWPYEATRLAVTVTTFRQDDGTILDADVLLNPAFDWALLDESGEPSGRFDVASVVTHELGHVLGLEHSEDPRATMWADTRRGDTQQRTLEQDDEDGVAEAYAEGFAAPVMPRGCGGATVASSAPPLGLALAGWVAGLFAVRRGRRRLRGIPFKIGTPRNQVGFGGRC
jgi:hypothetical protein